jgi:hypothetical protein
MRGLFDTPERQRLLRETGRHFRSEGWETSDVKSYLMDLRITNWKLRFDIACVSNDILQMKSEEKLLSFMHEIARDVNRKLLMIFVTDFTLRQSSFEMQATAGLAIVTFDELDIVSGLSLLQQDLPDVLNLRQRLLLKTCPWACIDISNRMRKDSKVSAAIGWARQSLEGRDVIPENYILLCHLYLQSGDLEEAQRAALEALQLFPGNSKLVSLLHKLAVKRGAPVEIEKYERLLQNIKDEDSFETIVARVQKCDGKMADVAGKQVEIAGSDVRRSRIFNRLRSMF